MYLCNIEVEADKLITKKRLRGRFRRKRVSESASTLDHLSGFFIMEHQENWKPVIDFEGLYEVSDLGRVKSLAKTWVGGKGAIITKKLTILKPDVGGRGYYMVTLSRNGKVKKFKVHRLVYESFNGKTNLQIDHIAEGNKTNNRLSNLQAITNRQNVSKYHLSTKKTSQYTGVSWAKPLNKWMAMILINGKRKHLGYFTSEIDAHNAYQNYLQNVLRTS